MVSPKIEKQKFDESEAQWSRISLFFECDFKRDHGTGLCGVRNQHGPKGSVMRGALASCACLTVRARVVPQDVERPRSLPSNWAGT